MMKNDITYEYRVFTHRPFDIESMVVGVCTSKVIKEIKPKDKINGRFFHTSDTDEWFFCWNNELQKLNLKGNSDVNDALEKVNKLIANANAAVGEAQNTAKEAKDAADEAKKAADAASAAVGSIGELEEAVANKADKDEFEKVAKSVEAKQNIIEDLEDIRTNASLAKTALQSIPEEYITESKLTDKKYATIDQVNVKQDAISDLETIRSGAAAGTTALQSIPTDISQLNNDAKYLNKDAADKLYAPIDSVGGGSGNYATIEQVNAKQDKIDDLEDIRTNAELAKTALQAVPAEYITEGELTDKKYATIDQVNAKQDKIDDLGDIRSGAALGATALQKGDLDGYLTANSEVIVDIKTQIEGINTLLGEATALTNTILNA